MVDKFLKPLELGDFIIYSGFGGPKIGCVIDMTAKCVRYLPMESPQEARAYDYDQAYLDNIKPKPGKLTDPFLTIKIDINFV